MPDQKNLKNEKKSFIHENIVKPGMTRAEAGRRLFFMGVGGLIFGAAAAATFAISEPAARRLLSADEPKETETISIPRDEPETTEAPTETIPPTTEEETEAIGEVVQSEMGKYKFSVQDLEKMYASINELAGETDRGIVTVHSNKTNLDWFNNPVERTGLYAGALIARTPDAYLVLTTHEAVMDADSLEITFADGTMASGKTRMTDTVSGMVILQIDATEVSAEEEKQLNILSMGNSYSVKQGDLIYTAGGPAGMIHSTSIGNISYVAKNIPIIDGNTRLFYTNAAGNSAKGTFLFNTDGEIIGWVTDDYKTEGANMTAVRALSDYKTVLERLINGTEAAYFGIMGQEVPESKRKEGMPLGVYVSQVVTDSPAYQAGIQNGDIITRIGEQDVVTMKDFRTCLDEAAVGDGITVEVQRNGRDDYAPVEFSVTIARR